MFKLHTDVKENIYSYKNKLLRTERCFIYIFKMITKLFKKITDYFKSHLIIIQQIK